MPIVYLTFKTIASESEVVPFFLAAASALSIVSWLMKSRMVVGDRLVIYKFGKLGVRSSVEFSELKGVEMIERAGEISFRISLDRGQMIEMGPWFVLNRKMLIEKLEHARGEIILRLVQ